MMTSIINLIPASENAVYQIIRIGTLEIKVHKTGINPAKNTIRLKVSKKG
jgi:hypothetical protein